MHVQAMDFIAASAAGLSPQSVLEIGSLDINGSVRPLFAGAATYHGLDLVAGDGVDEVADAATWDPGDRRFDLVVSAEVLEHAPAWRDVLGTMWRAPRPSIQTMAFISGAPAASTATVPDHWAVTATPLTSVAAAEVRSVLAEWGVPTWALEVHRDRGDLYLRVLKPR